MKVIFHLDLDSYFVSAERTINPSLNNKEVVICSGNRKSIITAASYEAKNKGIKVGNPLFLAKQIVPNIITIKPNFALYAHLSSKIFELISKSFTEQIEIASIDECYIDATKMSQQYKSPLKAAYVLQAKILNDLNLPISIGISSNKFIAKMSTQINKPFGITLTKPRDFLKVFGNWPIEKFHGIGKGFATRFHEIGITQIKDLILASKKTWESILGANASLYLTKVQGRDNDKIDVNMNELKSIGNSVTLQDYDKSTASEILEILSNLCHLVAIRSKNRNVLGNVISVTIKEKISKEIKTKSKQKTLVIPIQKHKNIYREAKNLFYKVWHDTTINFIGVTITKLENIFESTYQMNIEEKNKESNQEKIIKEINHKFKDKVTYLGKEQFLKDNKKRNQTRYLESDRILKH